MAQYGKNFYGSTYYGDTNAFSGTYETKEIDTEEVLNSTFDVNLNTILPDATYGPTSDEVNQVAGTWTYDSVYEYLSSSDASAELGFRATCDRLIIKYEQNSSAPSNINVEVTSTEPGQTPVVTTYTFSAYSTTIDTNATFVIDNLPYARQDVRIYLDSTNTAEFRFKGIDARVTHFTIETRGYVSSSWSAWTKVSTTKTVVDSSQSSYLISGTSPSYTGANRIQVKAWLASSDDQKSPIIHDLETIAGDSSNHTDDGHWEAIFDMHAVAGTSTDFVRVTEIDWVATVPDTTEMRIRTSSSSDKLSWGAESVPYMQGVNRLRLKEGINEGYMDLPYIQAGSTFTRTLSWDSWNDQSFLPPDDAATHVSYVFMDANKDESNPLHLITNPMRLPANEKSLLTTRLKDGRDCTLRVRLRRRFDKASPAVDWIKMLSWMEYKQDHEVTSFDISPVDNNNTGEKQLTSLDNYSFSPPPEVTSPEYILIDETGRPQDASIYYGSEANALSRTNTTTSSTDVIYAKAETRETGETQGVLKHYQYGGGTVKYPEVDEVEMASLFTPSLDRNLPYRYFLLSGWPTVFHTVVEGETLESIAVDYNKTLSEIQEANPNPVYDNDGNLVAGQYIEIPNDSVNSNVHLQWQTGGNLTDKSSHNARLSGSTNLESDFVQATVPSVSSYNTTDKGLVDWVSGEKKYDGIVNPNDIRNLYRRKHTVPSSGESAKVNYVVVEGDTYPSIAKKFGVNELDLRIENDAREGREPVVGETIVIPSLITLPTIDPKAIVSSNPYEMTIVYNSVKKKDGAKLSETVIVPQALDVEYVEDVIRGEEVVRGDIENGKDLLSKARVTEVLSVYEINDGVQTTYNETTEDGGVLVEGDFTLDGNHINWGETYSISTEPTAGTKYYVEYKYMRPKTVTVSIDTTYQEEGGVDHIWRSPEVKEFNGMCFPGQDYQAELPPFSAWRDSNDPYVEDFEYIIEDNDLWVKTYVKEKDGKFYVVGSLQDRVPKDNWFPTIQTGYYYLGKDEYYLFSEPIVFESTERDIAVVKNIEYGTGKYDKAAYLQKGSSNIIKNSGFEVTGQNGVVHKVVFT